MKCLFTFCFCLLSIFSIANSQSRISVNIEISDSSMAYCQEDIRIIFDNSLPVVNSFIDDTVDFNRLSNKHFQSKFLPCDTIIRLKVLPFENSQLIVIDNQNEIELNIQIKKSGLDFDFPENTLNKNLKELIDFQYMSTQSYGSDLITKEQIKVQIDSIHQLAMAKLDTILLMNCFPNIYNRISRKLELIKLSQIAYHLLNGEEANDVLANLSKNISLMNKDDINSFDLFNLAYYIYQYCESNLSDNNEILSFITENFYGIGRDAILYRFLENLIYFNKINNHNTETFVQIIENISNPNIHSQAKLLFELYKNIHIKSEFPDSFLRDVSDKSVKINALRGSIVYVDFWATWCKPCLDFIPVIEQLKTDLKDYDVKFVSIALENLKFNKWKNFIEKEKLSDWQLYAEYGFNNELARKLLLVYIPRFIIINKQGKIIDSFAPNPSDSKLMELLIELSKN